jgi:outer membrane protein
MKKLARTFIAMAIALLSMAGYAQTNAKLGYIDSNELLEMMPGKDSIQLVLQNYGKTLETQLQTMYQEYQNKLADYQANVNTMSTIIKQTKEKELGDLETRIQDFQQQADQDLQNKQMELVEPLVNKARKAIEEVGRENGYTYIFDAGVGTLLYFEKGDNIMPLVKQKLGLK